MSYVVSIKRLGGSPITPQQLRDVIRQDSTLREVEPSDGTGFPQGIVEVDWLPSVTDLAVPFTLASGEVTVTTPSNAALRKMQELAVFLDAAVYGEEGEDLTSVPVPGHEASGLHPIGCLAILVLAGAAIWWLVAR